MFYTFSQNNSGGGFDHDGARGIAQYVVIEADSAEDANERANEIGLYFDGVDSGDDCDCCGDRWREARESDGTYGPTIYGRDALTYSSDYGLSIFRRPPGESVAVHFADGTIQWDGSTNGIR